MTEKLVVDLPHKLGAAEARCRTDAARRREGARTLRRLGAELDGRRPSVALLGSARDHRDHVALISSTDG